MSCKNCLEHKKSRDCEEYCDKRSIVVVQDKKSDGNKKWTFKNPESKCVCLIHIDNCILNSEDGKKCDYLLLICDCCKKSAFFVELKGHDLGQAYKQINKTLSLLHNNLLDFDINVRIACTRVPKTVSGSANQARENIIKITKSTKKIIYSNSSTFETLS